MTLLAGLVVPLVLTGVRFVSVEFARRRLDSQQQSALNQAEARRQAESFITDSTARPEAGWICDTISGPERDYLCVRARSEGGAVEAILPLAAEGP